jgi:hypothetical protein
MGDIKEEIEKTANTLNINITEISKEKTQLIVNQVIQKYTEKKYGFLWEKFVNDVYIQNVDAWLWLDEIIGHEETIMFFNPREEEIAFKFLSGKDIVKLFGETFYFEFYLTNETTDYVLCFNHHDFLIACGTAKEKLQKKIESLGLST